MWRIRHLVFFLVLLRTAGCANPRPSVVMQSGRGAVWRESLFLPRRRREEEQLEANMQAQHLCNKCHPSPSPPSSSPSLLLFFNPLYVFVKLVREQNTVPPLLRHNNPPGRENGRQVGSGYMRSGGGEQTVALHPSMLLPGNFFSPCVSHE